MPREGRNRKEERDYDDDDDDDDFLLKCHVAGVKKLVIAIHI